jgi:hypothetical protein
MKKATIGLSTRLLPRRSTEGNFLLKEEIVPRARKKLKSELRNTLKEQVS